MSESTLADHIGRIGEDYFDLITNRAKIIVGQIQPDRLGRDRVLEFELEPIGEESYDKRSPPLGCSVQIKTILATKKRAKLSLAVAERLAGDVRPTFICILRIDEGDEIVDMHLVHLLDENLARILKRLRAEYAKGTTALNKKEMSFSISSGTKVNLDPPDFKAALIELIATDMETYASKKIHQRSSLGFDPETRFSGTVVFDVESTESLIDAMLGIGTVKIDSLEIRENRFSIPLPIDIPHTDLLQGGEFEVTTEAVDSAILRFRDDTSGATTDLECDVVSLGIPNLPFEKTKILLRTKFFDAFVKFNEFKIDNVVQIEENTAFNLQDWKSYFYCLQIVSSPVFKVELWTRNREMVFSGSVSQLCTSQLSYYNEIDVLEKLQALREKARATEGALRFQDLVNAQLEIRTVHAFFYDPDSVTDFTFTLSDELPLKVEALEVLYISYLAIGEERYAIGLKYNMIASNTNGKHTLTSRGFRPLKISKIDDPSTSLKDFADELGQITGVELRIVERVGEKPVSGENFDQPYS